MNNMLLGALLHFREVIMEPTAVGIDKWLFIMNLAKFIMEREQKRRMRQCTDGTAQIYCRHLVL